MWSNGKMTKTKPKVVFIKITHSSLMGNLFSGSSFDGDEGDIVRAIFLTKEMRDSIVSKGKDDPGSGYYIIRDGGFISAAFVTTEISDAEYRKAIRKMEKKHEEKIEKKKKLDKSLNWTSRALVAFRNQRKSVKNK